jgi:hypothetical protein
MKRPLAFLAIALGVGLMLVAGPAMAKPKPASKPAAYRHYVGCGLSKNADPARRCPPKSKKGAFFKSTKRDVFYSVCVQFPEKKRLCAQREKAEQGILYVNEITSDIPGEHKVTWFVEGKRVGLFVFTVIG